MCIPPYEGNRVLYFPWYVLAFAYPADTAERVILVKNLMNLQVKLFKL